MAAHASYDLEIPLLFEKTIEDIKTQICEGDTELAHQIDEHAAWLRTRRHGRFSFWTSGTTKDVVAKLQGLGQCEGSVAFVALTYFARNSLDTLQ